MGHIYVLMKVSVLKLAFMFCQSGPDADLLCSVYKHRKSIFMCSIQHRRTAVNESRAVEKCISVVNVLQQCSRRELVLERRPN